jgi:hypothetical protein
LGLGIQYRPSEGPLKGLRDENAICAQHTTLWQDGNVRSTQPEFRFIVDYTVLFRAPIEKTDDKTTIGRRAALRAFDSTDNDQNNKDRSQHCQNDAGDCIGHSRWVRRLSMSKAYLLTACSIGLAVFLLTLPCQAQGNIDRGKTPAQAFAETCTACHRGPRALKRTSAAFLRQHYSASSTEAAAMAAYLAGFPSEPVQQPKRPPGVETRTEAPKQQAKRQPIAGTTERSQTAAPQPSGERLTELSAGAPVADPSVAPAPPPKPVLEAFEE